MLTSYSSSLFFSLGTFCVYFRKVNGRAVYKTQQHAIFSKSLCSIYFRPITNEHYWVTLHSIRKIRVSNERADRASAKVKYQTKLSTYKHTQKIRIIILICNTLPRVGRGTLQQLVSKKREWEKEQI